MPKRNSTANIGKAREPKNAADDRCRKERGK